MDIEELKNKKAKAETEIAWILKDANYPDDAPVWIASGDLECLQNE